MDNQEEGSYFSFSSLFKFIKNALPTVVVCIVICLMVGVSACGAIYAINKNQNELTRAIFEIAYEGADEGKTPNGEILNIQDISSISRISEVLQSNDMAYSPAEVRNALTITGYYSPELRSLLASVGDDEEKLMEVLGNRSLHHTQFMVTLNHKAVPNMTRENAQIFLDGLLSKAKASMFTFSTRFSFMTEEEYAVDNFLRYEYLERISIINLELLKVEQHISDTSDKAKEKEDERSTRSLKALDPYLLGVRTSLASFETFVINEGIAANKEEAIALITTEITKLESSLSVLVLEIKDLKEAIDAYSLKFNVIVNESGTVVAGGEYVIAVYQNMYNKYLELLSDKSRQEVLVEELKLKKAKYENISTVTEQNSADRDKADQMFQKLIDDMGSLVSKVTLITKQFYESANMSSMRINMPSALVFDARVDINWILCVIMSVAIGILVGLAIYPVIKKITINKAKKNEVNSTTIKE